MSDKSVVEIDGEYHLQLKTKKRRLTNFVIRHTADGSGRYQLLQRGKVQHTIVIPPSAWESRGAFLTALQGIGNYAFLGKSADEIRLIQRLVHDP